MRLLATFIGSLIVCLSFGACTTTNTQALESRIASLEAELAQLKSRDALRLRRLEIVDAEGNVRVAMGQRQDEDKLLTGIAVMDAEGNHRVGMGMDSDGAAGMAIRHKDGSRRYLAVAFPEGDSGFGLFDAAGILRVVLAVDKKNDAIAVVRDEDGEIVRELNSGQK